MVRIAAFRGALWNSARVDVAKVTASAISGVAPRLAAGELERDAAPAVYRYHQVFKQGAATATRKTLLATVELVPWSDGSIVAHEATSRLARELALRGITNEAAHTDAVLCGYEDTGFDVDVLFAAREEQAPHFEVTTADGTTHRVWRETNAQVIAKLQSAFAPKKLTVLDGHGRYEGMLAYRDELTGDKRAAASFGLICLVNLADPALEAVPRHRVVRDAPARDALLAAAKPYFAIEKLARARRDTAQQSIGASDPPSFIAVFPDDPDAYKLTLTDDKAVGEGVHEALRSFDSVVVQRVLLDRVIPGLYARSVIESKTVSKALDEGAELGLLLRPITLAQILHTVELGQLLPFGSTAFRPALARVVIHLLS